MSLMEVEIATTSKGTKPFSDVAVGEVFYYTGTAVHYVKVDNAITTPNSFALKDRYLTTFKLLDQVTVRKSKITISTE
jgi:hypothetical protein